MTKTIKNAAAVILYIAAVIFSAKAQNNGEIISAENVINWGKEEIYSTVTLDVESSGIILPDGRESVYQIMRRKLPELISPVIFSIHVDSSKTLGEAVSSGEVSLSEIHKIIDDGKRTTPWFSQDLKTSTMVNTMSLSKLREIFVKHRTAYNPKKPLDSIPTRTYSGIIIDARGKLPVHGEFTEEKLVPAMFPKIRTTQMKTVYERNMVYPETAAKTGIVSYALTPAQNNCISTAGDDPLYIKAAGVYGISRTDPVISERDYLRIFCDAGNLELLRQGRVVILCDEDVIETSGVPKIENENYYFVRRDIERFLEDHGVEGVGVAENKNGITLTIYGIRFIADSAEILPEEYDRIHEIAAALASTEEGTRFIIEGHTASVGRPRGELQLSFERAEAIAGRLIAAGIDGSRIETTGYGGTRPVAPNDTEENKARNRRVEITAVFDE